MALDTLPSIGRTLLLATLLSISLCGVGAAIRRHPSGTMQLYYRKAAIVVLAGLPLLISFFGIKMPVYVEQAQQFGTSIPAWISYAVAFIWLCGVVWGVWQLLRQIMEAKAGLIADGAEIDDTIQKRVKHWLVRLNISPGPRVLIGGSCPAAQTGSLIVLPEAAKHWQVGQLDVLLLLQLAQSKQRGWLWLIFSKMAMCLYWPFPWVERLFRPMPELLVESARPLARAAYRDPDGWRRDRNKLADRYETLSEPKADMQICLVSGIPNDDPASPPSDVEPGSWAATRQRRAERYFDPYERVYWLVAVASVVVSVGSTLTIRQASPEFEPGFLNIRWQDQMGRRVSDGRDPVQTDLRAQERAETTDDS